jgi:hypothetical protein
MDVLRLDSARSLHRRQASDRGDAMPEAQNDIDYTVDIRRHETTFRANTAKGEEFLGGVDLTMSNEEAHTFIQDARAAGLTVKSFF